MYIRRIELNNWKAYQSAVFEFPAPSDNQNIVLIGARNGYGKTSLFQAILLGMYGKDGFDLIKRSLLSGRDGQYSSYSNFLKSVLHKNAIGEGARSCAIKIKFVNGSQTPIEIDRRWYFSSAGVHLAKDDQVDIFESDNRTPVGPANKNEDPIVWKRNYIERALLPPNLSSFFLFDGEKASIFADHDMAVQVKMGITGLLGIPIIQELAEDLRSYVIARKPKAPNVSDDTIAESENTRTQLKKQLDQQEKLWNDAQCELTQLKHDRDSILQELMSFGVDSQTNIRQKTEQLSKLENEIANKEEQLSNLLATDIALALAGRSLRKNLATRLKSESTLNKWEAGKQQGDSRIDAFIDALSKGMTEIAPPIYASQRTRILEIARAAWEKLWFPPPENCARDYLHPYLTEGERGTVTQHLEKLNTVSAPQIISLLASIKSAGIKQKELRAEVNRLAAIEPHLQEKRNLLTPLNKNIDALNQQIGEIRRKKTSLDAKINSKNEELGRLYTKKDSAKPHARRNYRATKVANMIDAIVNDAVPSQINAIAGAMTSAYKDIAHKGLVEKIDIDDQCGVKLLNGDGEDVRDLDTSAGEKQIFTQALISAISAVSGRAFPMVIDTPLGRLDKRHRVGVLRHLVKPHRQVILLSTDTEVVQEYLCAIESQIQKKYLINHDVVTGTSTATVGYFDSEVTE